MVDITKYNNKLIQKDLDTLMSLNRYLNSFSVSDKSILFLCFMRYNNFIILEILNYIESVYNLNVFENVKHKKLIKKFRSKLKCNVSVLQTIEETNKTMHKIFKTMNNPIVMKLFPNLCDNFGIWFYNKSVIGNTFEIYAIMKKIIYTNDKPDKKKIISYSEEIGSIMVTLCNVFHVNKKFEAEKISNKEIIKSNDYNLYKFKYDECLNKTIFYINKLSVLNFYKEIISSQFKEKINSLDLKIKYVICRNSVEELKEIDFEFDYQEYDDIFSNLEIRNFMYHYAFPKKFADINYNNVLFGVCESTLNMTEKELNDLLNKCLEELIKRLTKEINKTKYRFLIN